TSLAGPDEVNCVVQDMMHRLREAREKAAKQAGNLAAALRALPADVRDLKDGYHAVNRQGAEPMTPECETQEPPGRRPPMRPLTSHACSSVTGTSLAGPDEVNCVVQDMMHRLREAREKAAKQAGNLAAALRALPADVRDLKDGYHAVNRLLTEGAEPTTPECETQEPPGLPQTARRSSRVAVGPINTLTSNRTSLAGPDEVNCVVQDMMHRLREAREKAAKQAGNLAAALRALPADVRDLKDGYHAVNRLLTEGAEPTTPEREAQEPRAVTPTPTPTPPKDAKRPTAKRSSRVAVGPNSSNSNSGQAKRCSKPDAFSPVSGDGSALAVKRQPSFAEEASRLKARQQLEADFDRRILFHHVDSLERAKRAPPGALPQQQQQQQQQQRKPSKTSTATQAGGGGGGGGASRAQHA
ncbi:hypothetical protein DIPPA_35055, partial [Diplonema papillatum]